MPFVLFFTIEDADGDPSRVEIAIDDSVDISDVPELVETAWNLINPLTNGHLITAGFTLETDISGFTNAVANVLADVQEKAEFVYRTAGGFIKRLNIPAFVKTLFGGAGKNKEVDLTDTNVAAFNIAMLAGIPYNIAEFAPVVDTRGDDLVSVVTGRENWGKRRL